MGRLHSFVWLVWLGLVMWIVSLIRNPFYLTLLWIWIAIINIYTRGTENTIWNSVWTLWASLGIIPMSALFNMLTTHFGDHILFTIPGKIPLLSGIVTGEALVYGLTNGLVLNVIINAFWTFNRNVPIQSLLRLIPRAFYPMAVISSIAVTFIPITIRQYQQIQEAQAIRGQRRNNLRDTLALMMPLLTSSLERAFQLAEVLTARGFHNPNRSAKSLTAHRWSFLAGLILIFSGWQWKLIQPVFPFQAVWLGKFFFLLGMLLFFFPFWRMGKVSVHTRYVAEKWRIIDGLGLATQLVIAIALLSLSFRGDPSLSYSPYPSLMLPGFNPWIGFLLGGLSLPAFFQKIYEHD